MSSLNDLGIVETNRQDWMQETEGEQFRAQMQDEAIGDAHLQAFLTRTRKSPIQITRFLRVQDRIQFNSATRITENSHEPPLGN
ncbi:MAG: hypothetical protein M1281_10255 [Chloroflexi bacterium]|nr:hypothetical protein [Chloroflexota bacterium]